MIKNSKSGFSFVELMVILVFFFLLMTALFPLVTRRHRNVLLNGRHGIYACYLNDGEDKATKPYTQITIQGNNKKVENVAKCGDGFKPPASVKTFFVNVIGGGGAGSDVDLSSSKYQAKGNIEKITEIDESLRNAINTATEDATVTYNLTPGKGHHCSQTGTYEEIDSYMTNNTPFIERTCPTTNQEPIAHYINRYSCCDLYSHKLCFGLFTTNPENACKQLNETISNITTKEKTNNIDLYYTRAGKNSGTYPLGTANNPIHINDNQRVVTSETNIYSNENYKVPTPDSSLKYLQIEDYINNYKKIFLDEIWTTKYTFGNSQYVAMSSSVPETVEYRDKDGNKAYFYPKGEDQQERNKNKNFTHDNYPVSYKNMYGKDDWINPGYPYGYWQSSVETKFKNSDSCKEFSKELLGGDYCEYRMLSYMLNGEGLSLLNGTYKGIRFGIGTNNTKWDDIYPPKNRKHANYYFGAFNRYINDFGAPKLLWTQDGYFSIPVEKNLVARMFVKTSGDRNVKNDSSVYYEYNHKGVNHGDFSIRQSFDDFYTNYNAEDGMTVKFLIRKFPMESRGWTMTMDANSLIDAYRNGKINDIGKAVYSEADMCKYDADAIGKNSTHTIYTKYNIDLNNTTISKYYPEPNPEHSSDGFWIAVQGPESSPFDILVNGGSGSYITIDSSNKCDYHKGDIQNSYISIKNETGIVSNKNEDANIIINIDHSNTQKAITEDVYHIYQTQSLPYGKGGGAGKLLSTTVSANELQDILEKKLIIPGNGGAVGENGKDSVFGKHKASGGKAFSDTGNSSSEITLYDTVEGTIGSNKVIEFFTEWWGTIKDCIGQIVDEFTDTIILLGLDDDTLNIFKSFGQGGEGALTYIENPVGYNYKLVQVKYDDIFQFKKYLNSSAKNVFEIYSDNTTQYKNSFTSIDSLNTEINDDEDKIKNFEWADGVIKSLPNHGAQPGYSGAIVITW